MSDDSAFGDLAERTPVRALAIGAHPDDIELFAGGVLSAWAAAGCTIVFVVLTDGRLGCHDPTMPPQDVAARRTREALAAAEALGATFIQSGTWDGALTEHRADAVERIGRAIREHKPEVVLAHDAWRSYEPHPDHRAAGFAAVDAVMAAREHHGLPGVDLPAHRPAETWLAGSDTPNVFVDVASVIDEKVKLLAYHASQFQQPGWERKVLEWNALIGAQRGYRYAEAFRLLRLDPGSPAAGALV